ncbi:MAG: omptin family outer membrane protease [Thermodesulfobacteriota bacterium]
MKRLPVSVLSVLFVFVLSGAAFAAGPSEMYIKAGVEGRYIAAGETINTISFDNPWMFGGHGESELEFPIKNNFFTGVNLEIGTLFDGDMVNKPAAKLSVMYLQAVGGDTGVMRDSDWIENDAAFGAPMHAGKDIFTTSDDELVAGRIFDINFIYNFKINEQVTMGPVLGYMYQKFTHDVTGCNGYSWIDPAPPVAVNCANETVIDFENEQSIPYFGVNSEVFFGDDDKSSISLSLLYSGWVSAAYTDIHRYPPNTPPDIDRHFIGNLDGDAYIARLNTDWYFSENWLFSVGGEYLEIKTNGKEKQREYTDGVLTGVSTGAIDSTLDTTMLSVYMRFGYAFF